MLTFRGVRDRFKDPVWVKVHKPYLSLTYWRDLGMHAYTKEYPDAYRDTGPHAPSYQPGIAVELNKDTVVQIGPIVEELHALIQQGHEPVEALRLCATYQKL